MGRLMGGIGRVGRGVAGTAWRRRRRTIFWGFMLCWCPALVLAATSDGEIGEPVRKAVVKVYVTTQPPNRLEPWQAGAVASATGSGCVVAGNRILTAAHVVARQTYLQVRRHGETQKHDARVVFVAHDVDLALLTVDEPTFFDGIEPLNLAPLPAAQAAVTALGFPTGGDTLSLTSGIVSRVEHRYYSHSGGSFLAIQIDAAVNAGNSGGPVVQEQRLVGLAMQSMTYAQSISYVVPSPVIQRFLDDVADGTYDGVPQLGVTWQPVENRAMMVRYGVEDGAGGVLLRTVAPASGTAAALRPGDVLLSIEGTPIAEDGTVEFRPGERTSFEHLIDEKQRGSEVEVAFMRDGQRHQARITLTARFGQGRLVPVEEHEADASYFVVAGIVLRPLTTDYLYAFGDEWWRNAPDEFLAARPKMSSFEGEGLVVMTNIFPDEVNQGYQVFGNVLVTTIDGVRPRNFLHAVALIENGKDEFLALGLADTNTIVVNRAAAKARQTAILERYRVRFDRSFDLRKPELKTHAGHGAPSALRRACIADAAVAPLLALPAPTN